MMGKRSSCISSKHSFIGVAILMMDERNLQGFETRIMINKNQVSVMSVTLCSITLAWYMH